MSSHGGGGKEALWVSFSMVLIPTMKAPPSRSNHLPNVPPPDTITLETGFQHTNLYWGGAYANKSKAGDKMGNGPEVSAAR